MKPFLQVLLLILSSAVARPLAAAAATATAEKIESGDLENLVAYNFGHKSANDPTSGIAQAIDKFKAAVENRTASAFAPSATAHKDERLEGDGAGTKSGSSNSNPVPSARSDNGDGSAIYEQQHHATTPIRRKIIRSRYRLRSHKEPALASDSIDRQSSLSNFSQPFHDGTQQGQRQQQQQTSSSLSPAPSSFVRQQDHYLAQLGRALGSSASVGAPSDAGAPPASYSYLAGPPQRLATSSSLGGGGDTQGAGSGSGSYALESLPMSQDNEITSDGYVTAVASARLNHNHQPTSSSHLHFPTMMSRMYPQPPSTSAYASDGQQRVRSAPADLPYYLAAPSYGDYHGSASSVPSSLATSAVPSDYQLGEMMARDHYAMRNYTGPDSSAADYAPGSHLAGFDYMDNPMTSSRSRWSWPWTDVSSFAGSGQGGLGGGENSLSTAATFKKHHHHHYHPKHKELHHHELGQHEEHMVMPKWEHGITVGEIVCVALAVVLGIVILGSPFFLLFLMLFNGGNLFGATQMGLLAPAAVSAAAAQGTGRRRRRRSVGSANDVDPHPSTTGKLKMRTSDLVRAGEYLFERLSPFMDADKLMRSFQRIMDVKDDIERIIGKIADEPKYSAGHREEAKTAAGQHVEPAASHQHVEMRRRK